MLAQCINMWDYFRSLQAYDGCLDAQIQASGNRQCPAGGRTKSTLVV